jgi:hypothetical protein
MTDGNGQLTQAEEAAVAAGYGVLVTGRAGRALTPEEDAAEARRAAAEARRRNDAGLPPPPLPGTPAARAPAAPRRRTRPPRAPGSAPVVTSSSLGMDDTPPLVPQAVQELPRPAFTMPSAPVPGLTASAMLVSPELLELRDREKARLVRLREQHMDFVHQIDLALASLKALGTTGRGRPPGSARPNATYAMLRRYAAEGWNPEDGPITAGPALEWIKANGWDADVVNEMGTVASCLAHLVRRSPREWSRTGTGEYAWTPPE